MSFDKFLLKNMKNLKITNGNTHLTFKYDNLIENGKLIFIFVYSFMKSKPFTSNEPILSRNFHEVLIIFSECLLDNFK